MLFMSENTFQSPRWSLSFAYICSHFFVVCVSLSLLRLSLIEPGPVRTDFELKMIQEVKERECPGADPETVYYFKELYLPSAINIFPAVGQTPDNISKVSSQSLSVCTAD